jgi:hypothetical protein
MLLKTALVLFVVWLIGVLGLYEMGTAVHIFLLAGGMLFLLGFAKARDAAMAASREPQEPPAPR